METARKTLNNAFRRILRPEAKSSSLSTRREYLNHIIVTFNEYYAILKSNWNSISIDDREKYKLKFANDSLSLEKCIVKVYNFGSVKIPIEIDDPVVVERLSEISEEEDNASEEVEQSEETALDESESHSDYEDS